MSLNSCLEILNIITEYITTRQNRMRRKLIITTLISIATVGILAIASCVHNKIEVDATPVASTIPSDNPCVKVFIENSGSMDGYMCDGSQLKDAVYDYISDLNRNTSSTELYYINSKIIPYKGDLTSYIKDLNPASFHKAGGNIANTDLGNIIASVLNNVNDTTVAIFISDCILDLPSKDAKKFLTNCEIRIKDEVINAQKRIDDFGVEILKLSSDFNGKYFYPNGSIEKLDNVKRPYYIWIFGNKNYLAKLNSEVPISQLSKYDLGGIVAFTNQSSVPFDIYNNNLTSKTVIPERGDYHLIIQADFRSTLQPEGIVQDNGNYTFNNPALIVDGIYPITDSHSKYTHFIKFTIPKSTMIAQDCLTFSVSKLPSWVSESNDETGINIKENIDKTTGIKYLIQGVADAYKNETVTTTFNFNIKRK